ncbi:energy-coupling factor ABC transporter permease [Conexibacter sp. SYSU D00693]|uniref:energy-coupling factor ABC transporter permease n=1 Tax=Conexibacter sp. SYSU D00693 TaxID=2812560 RepID=UPI00196B84B9|nr:energy-coupling factor ABC transporter permease [Conexibacter sp. SYSU D00693]
MHIPDGFLSGEAAVVGAAIAAPGVALCLRKAREEARERDLPVAGLAAAFFLVGDAPLFPVGAGTQGHLLGGTLAVLLLGPWLGALTVTVVTVIQAFVLGDGGITALGLGVVNLALVPALVGYPLVLLLRRFVPLPAAGAVAAWVCVVLAACLFTTELVLGAAVDLDETRLASTTIGTYAVVGVVEGAITALIVRGLLGVRPDLLRVARWQPQAREARRRVAEPAEGAA